MNEILRLQWELALTEFYVAQEALVRNHPIINSAADLRPYSQLADRFHEAAAKCRRAARLLAQACE